MSTKQQFPSRPVRTTVICFLMLSAFTGICIPFQEQPIREGWPWAIAYCAGLSIATIGLIRLGRRAIALLGIPFAVAIAPGVIGFALILRPGGSLDAGGVWLQSSVYMFYALGAWGLFWVSRGWMLYLRETNDNG